MKARRWHLLLLLLVVACPFVGLSAAGASTGPVHQGPPRERAARAHVTSLPPTASVDTTQHRGTKKSASELLDTTDGRDQALAHVPHAGPRALTGKPRSPIVLRAPGRAPPVLLIAS